MSGADSGRWQMLRAARVETAPDAADPRLRGRTYSIPFQEVWQAVLELVLSQPHWIILGADDTAGVITVETPVPVFGSAHDLTIRVTLDRNAQTRVDAISRTRSGKAGWGLHRRRIDRLFRELDRSLLGAGRHRKHHLATA